MDCERTRLHELKKDKTVLSDVADADHSTMSPDPLSDWSAVSLRCRVPRRMPSVIFDPSPTPTFPLADARLIDNRAAFPKRTSENMFPLKGVHTK